MATSIQFKALSNGRTRVLLTIGSRSQYITINPSNNPEKDTLILGDGQWTLKAKEIALENNQGVITFATADIDKSGSDPVLTSSAAADLYDEILSNFFPKASAGAASGGGLPTGGATNQIIIKSSNADGDAHWATPPFVPIAQTATTNISPADGTVIKIDLTNTVNNRVQATRQLFLYGRDAATNSEPTDPDTSKLMDTTMLNLKQRRDTGSDYPAFISMSVPEYGRTNGRILRHVNLGPTSCKVQDIVKGSMPAALNKQAVGYDLITIIDEQIDTNGRPPVACRFSAVAYNRDNPSRFLSVGISAFVDYRSVMWEWVDWRNDDGSTGAPYGKTYMRIRQSGDIHFGGAQYVAQKAVSTAAALSLDTDVFVYTGATAGDILTLPDPADADNAGRTHRIVNMGSVDLTFSREVYLDALTTTTALTFAHPSNKLRIMCDGAKWIAI